jgi:competence protein ComEA
MKFATRILNLIPGLLLGLLAVGILNMISGEPRGSPVILLPPPTPSPLRVHVTGAVLEPGVYTLPPDSIVKDALQTSGGSLPDADLENINLAAPLLDGQQIYIASHQETPHTPEASTSSISTPSSKMNINTADAPELEDLPGIGPSLAQKIIAYRQDHGPFMSIEDLLKVPGIGPAKLEQIKDLIIIR